MVVGFNHNVMYKGQVFHIQTEDSGISNPHIITLLYRGGTILGSKKTSYADIIKVDNLEQVVEELMKEQHKEMLRRLKAGEFDGRAFGAATDPSPEAPAQVASAAPLPPPSRTEKPTAAATPIPTSTQPESPRRKQSLDEIILDYLVGGDDK